MAVSAGSRPASSPPFVSFSNLPANYTTPKFELPAGAGELQLFPANPNNPGTITLTVPTDNSGAATTASNSVTYTLSTGVGDIPGYTGSLWFQTLGGKTFTIATTAAVQSVVIYFFENTDI